MTRADTVAVRCAAAALLGGAALLIAGCASQVPGTATGASETQASSSATAESTSASASSTTGEADSAGCVERDIAADLGRPGDQTVLIRCEGDWALLDNGGTFGDTAYLARRADGRWQHYSSFPARICRDQAAADGVPADLVPDFAPCPYSIDADLGLSVPISSPTCDGRAVLILGNAVTPGGYERDVAALLEAHPGASYLRTDRSCGSLRDRDDDGDAIYAVYREVGHGRADACAALAGRSDDAYGKLLDEVSDPAVFISRADC